jgi:hypothetical protein
MHDPALIRAREILADHHESRETDFKGFCEECPHSWPCRYAVMARDYLTLHDEAERLRNQRITCPTCGKDSASLRSAECYNCRNAPYWLLDDEQAKLSRLLKASLSLVNQLDFVHGSSAWKSIWTIAYVHGNQYKGPNYNTELEALRTEVLRQTVKA